MFNNQPIPTLSNESEPVWEGAIKEMIKTCNALQQEDYSNSTKSNEIGHGFDDLVKYASDNHFFEVTPEEIDKLEKIMNERNEFGIKKYNTPLSTFNGRDAVQDAFEETLDLYVYAWQALMEEDKIETSHYNIRHDMLRALFRTAKMAVILAFNIKQLKPT